MLSLNNIKMSLIRLLNEVKQGLNIFAEDIEQIETIDKTAFPLLYIQLVPLSISVQLDGKSCKKLILVDITFMEKSKSSNEDMYEMVELTNSILPKDKPRYLMGVGTPINLLENIAQGVDMFDCIMPTRNGRNGQLFTSRGTINIRNAKWAREFSPIDPEGYSFVDSQYSLAYLHHLIRADELLGLQIASIHNLAFYLRLVREAREHILAGDFVAWKTKMVRQMDNRL